MKKLRRHDIGEIKHNRIFLNNKIEEMYIMSEINVGFRIDLIKRLLDSTQNKVDECDLSPLTTPSLIENFGSMSGNLMLLDIAIDDRKATQEQIKEFEALRNRYYNLERDFTNNCNCKKKKMPI